MRHSQFAIILLILVAFAIRAHDLDAQSLWIDEGATFHRATKDLGFILTNRIVIDGVVTTDTQPPIYFILLHWTMQGAGATPFVARLFSALAGLPSISLLYLIGRRLGSELAAVCAALAAALAPVYLWYGQEARPYALLMSVSLLSVYALLRLVAREGRGAEEQGGGGAGNSQLQAASVPVQMKWGLIYVLATGATVYTHYSGLLLLGFQGLFLLALAVISQRRWLILMLAGAAALISPVVPFVIHRMGLGAERDYSFVPLPTILWDLANGLSLGPSVRAEQVWWLDVLFLLIALVGLIALTRAGRWGWALWIVGYLAVPILTLYVASYIKPMYMGVRHLLIISPAYYLALGLGLAALARWRRVALVAGLAVILTGTGYSIRNYFTDPAYLKDDHRGMATYLEEHARPGDVIVVDGPIRAYVLSLYYAGVAPLITLPPYGSQPGPDTLASLQELAAHHERIWFAYGVPGDDWMNPAGEKPIRAWRKATLFQFTHTYFHGLDDAISLQGYLTSSPVLTRLPPQAVPVEVNLSGELTLRGVAGERQASEVWPPVTAGDPLDVVLYWQPAQPLEDYRVVLNLLDAEGRRWGTSDQLPYERFFPPSEWPVGDIVAWRQSLQVDPTAPPGRYTLTLRVYAPASGQALDLVGLDGNPAGQQVDLGLVSVTRPAGPPELPPGLPTHRLRARWPDGIELLGYDQLVDTVTLGEPAPLNLYFTSRATPGRDLVLRLRLVDAAGREATTAVAPPVAPGYPTSQWQPGDVLKGQHSLRLPASAAPGAYTWCLRLQDESGEAVPVRRGRGWWPFATSEICLGTVTAEAPPLAPTPEAIPRPLEATFGEDIRLLGHNLVRTSVGPGEALSVTLFWQAQEHVTASYKVSVQLLSSEAKIVAQDDSVPAGWTRPTTGWRPGEVITDEHTLTVDPEAAPGRYTLIVALYDERTGQRLPVTSGTLPADHVRLSELMVEGQ